MCHSKKVSRTAIIKEIAGISIVGVTTGLVGILTTLLLHTAEHQLAHLTHTTMALISLGVGALAGTCWWALRRRGPIVTVTAALSTDTPLPLWRTLADALLQLLIVTAGASLGKEQAPRQLAAALAERIAPAHNDTDRHRRIRLLAAAAGAGLAAMYHVPIAGIFFVLELLPVRRDRATIATTIAVCAIATTVASPVVPAPLYGFPHEALGVNDFLPLLVVTIVATVVAVMWRRLTVTQLQRSYTGPWLVITLPLALAITYAVGTWFPAVHGNGQLVLDVAFGTDITALMAFVLLLAKLMATLVCIRAGAVGGVLTPSLAVGAAAGMCVAVLFGAPNAVMALVAAAIVLAITQRAPLFGAAMAIELTHPDIWLAATVVVTAAAGFWCTRKIR
ncbi:chloride channel protein [Corynebacterium diphtheriae bv. gravis]|uniref:chloride channel protein n=1 Tax=Corynebacterium diphtheriae TaxID=1717 RepID=UPI000B4B8072|nr:chloride channel protein [Corynebacterium diphtheriae]OWO36792.1 chloride channel protein [Corynebacterium diphtheriae bv. gravis]